MNHSQFFSSSRWIASLLVAGSTFVAGCSTTKSDIQDSNRPSTPQGSHDAGAMALPPGMTQADMDAFMKASTPGPNQEFLAKKVGTWSGMCTQWMAPSMAPGMAPTTSSCTMTIASEFDGRYTRGEFKGDMPGMGPFHGLGYYGFDNVSQKFVSTWLDNMSTGIMTGEGTLSSDRKTLTWNFEFNCPMTKGPAKMREVERSTGEDTMTLEMYGDDPKTGKEYQMMKMEMKRTSRGSGS